MAALSELLERFRHGGTPGAPSAGGGVPADPMAALEDELRPLFSALDAIDEEAQGIQQEALQEAPRIRSQAASEAARILAEARERVVAMRSAAAHAAGVEPDGEVRAILDAAAAEASAIRERARGRMPGLIARIVQCVGEGPHGPGPPPSS